MLNILLGLLAILTTGFTIVYVSDFLKNKKSEKFHLFKKGLVVGFITDFFDAIGVGSFATTTAIFKLSKGVDVPDKLLPGTLNVAHALPMVAQAFLSLKVIEIDPATLVLMIISAVVGSWIGAGIMSKLPERKVQLTMGLALIVVAGLITLGQLNLMPAGGDAMELTGSKLIIGCAGNFILGALMTAGIGLYAPCMAMVALLGMNPKASFPIMMGACAFVGPIACIKFVKEGAYEREISMGVTLSGIVGSIIALLLVKNMPVYWLKWLVVAVVLYTSYTMLVSANKKRIDAKLEECV